MRVRKVVLVFAAAAVLMGQTADMGVMLQRAIRMENVEGNLNSAIDLYKKVIAGATDRAIAAKALLGLGECYEKQGNGEAQKAYERLVKEFGDQAEASHAAQARLAAMGKTREGVVAQLIMRSSDVAAASGLSVSLEVSIEGLSGRVTPDGRWYVYVDAENGNLAARDLESGAVKRLTNDAAGTGQGHAHAVNPVPSRDGKQVVFGWRLATPGLADYPTELRVINIDGSGMRTVPAKLNRMVKSAVLDCAPDGKGVLLWTAVPDTTPATGWPPTVTPGHPAVGFAIIDIRTGEQRPIVRSGLFADPVEMSPDGRWIVYSRSIAQGNRNRAIFAVDTQTGQEKAIITGPAMDRAAEWVPGSDRIVFRSDLKGKNGIWIARFKDGSVVGDPVLVKADAGDYTPLGISRDGSVFYSLSHQSSDIYSVAADPVTLRAQGAPAAVVSSYPGRNMWPSWSPTGDAFAYFSDRDTAGGSRLVVQHAGGKETMAERNIISFAFPPHWCGDDTIARDNQRFDARTGELLPPQKIKGLQEPFQIGLTPDCRSAYVTSVVGETERRRIYRNEIATGKETDLLIDGGERALMPLVSPDEHWLALWGRLEGSTKTTIILLPTQGGSPRALDVDGLNQYGFSWAPDSKRLLLSRQLKSADGKGPEDELFWISVEGGAAQSMGIRMPGLSAPSLNADGKRLLFSATETSNELWVLRNLPLK